MRTIIIALVGTLLCLPALAVVTPEDIAAQRVKVRMEQAALDSLESLAKAEALGKDVDIVLMANQVTVEQVTKHPLTDMRDAMYVDVDLTTLYGTWDKLQQREWAIELRESGLDIRTVAPGRYALHSGEVPKLKALIKEFINTTVEVIK